MPCFPTWSCSILNNLLACGHISPILRLRKLGSQGMEDCPRSPHTALKTVSPGLLVLYRATSILWGRLGNIKYICETGPYLKEVHLVQNLPCNWEEYSHRRYQQHWPLSLEGQLEKLVWKLGRIFEEGADWNRAVLAKGPQERCRLFFPSYILLFSPPKICTQKPSEFSHSPLPLLIATIILPALSQQPPNWSHWFSPVCRKHSSPCNQILSLLCPKACNGCPFHKQKPSTHHHLGCPT